jgi:hypothetical protein
MIDGLIWLSGNVSCASLIAWVPSTCWDVWNTCLQFFDWKIQNTTWKY